MFLITVLASIYRYLLLPAVCLFSAVVQGFFGWRFRPPGLRCLRPSHYFNQRGGKVSIKRDTQGYY